MNLGATLYFGGLHSDGNGGYLQTLRSVLDPIPGKFIIFIQACHSGHAINRSEQSDQDNDVVMDDELYEQEILKNFFGTTRNGELAGSAKYTVFCSVQGTQSSTPTSRIAYSRSTYAWAKGLGWQIIGNTGQNGTSCDLFADKILYIDNEGNSRPGNNDGIVTAEELNCYAIYILHEYYNKQDETPCYYSMQYFRTIATMDYFLGDANKSGGITSQDVTKIQNYIAGNTTLDSRQKKLANVNGSYDANGNDTITMVDVNYLQRYLADLPVPVPNS